MIGGGLTGGGIGGGGGGVVERRVGKAEVSGGRGTAGSSTQEENGARVEETAQGRERWRRRRAGRG